MANPSSNGDLPSLILHWHDRHPLPVRCLRISRRPRASLETPPYWKTGPLGQPFDFCGRLRRLVADIVQRCDALRHIQVERVLIGMTRARTYNGHGLQARLTPLRFAHGRLFRRRRSVTYQVQRYFVGRTEMLYIMAFCLPRFLDQDFEGKFVTLFHELYHIGPAFDGDMRRHHGRYTVHSHSQRCYDRHMAELARAYLADRPDPDLHAFFRLNFDQLQHRHGAVAGIVVPRPRIIPVHLVSDRPAFPARAIQSAKP